MRTLEKQEDALNKQFLLHIIYTNVTVSVSAGLLTAGLLRYAGVEQNELYGWFSALATFTVYNGQRLYKSRANQSTPWLQWVSQNQVLLWTLVGISCAAACFMLYLIGHLSANAAFLLVLGGLISLFYVVPLGRYSLRELPYVKIHLIAFTWAALLVAFPLLNEGFTAGVLWISVAHYFYVLAVAIPFDIRDLKYDSKNQKTIPQTLGVANSKGLAVILLLFFLVMIGMYNVSFLFNPVFILAVVVQIGFVLLIHEKRSDFYCAVGIDGSISLLGIAYFLMHFF